MLFIHLLTQGSQLPRSQTDLGSNEPCCQEDVFICRPINRLTLINRAPAHGELICPAAEWCIPWVNWVITRVNWFFFRGGLIWPRGDWFVPRVNWSVPLLNWFVLRVNWFVPLVNDFSRGVLLCFDFDHLPPYILLTWYSLIYLLKWIFKIVVKQTRLALWVSRASRLLWILLGNDLLFDLFLKKGQNFLGLFFCYFSQIINNIYILILFLNSDFNFFLTFVNLF